MGAVRGCSEFVTADDSMPMRVDVTGGGRSRRSAISGAKTASLRPACKVYIVKSISRRYLAGNWPVATADVKDRNISGSKIISVKLSLKIVFLVSSVSFAVMAER